MKKHENALSPEAALLDSYLSQYKVCIRVKKSLERRRNDIRRELNYTQISSPNLDGMPRGGGTGFGCAALVIRLDEIDTRIREQITKATKLLSKIMDIIEYLPESSVERSIIEHKYIDRMGWEAICRVEILSRTPAIQHWRKGLYKLLEFKRVKAILKAYKKEQEGGEGERGMV